MLDNTTTLEVWPVTRQELNYMIQGVSYMKDHDSYAGPKRQGDRDVMKELLRRLDNVKPGRG